MSAHILLTGATGYIGFAILLKLLGDGYKVRFTARSQRKLDAVVSNPALQKLQRSDHLEGVLIPDMGADGAFDTSMQGITHILHVGSPVPGLTTTDFKSDIYIPTLQMSANILSAALKTRSVKRIIITNSIVALGPMTANSSVVMTPTTRQNLNDGGNPPAKFDDFHAAYIAGKIHGLQNEKTFMQTQSPHFTYATIFPGFVYGRNELTLNTQMALMENSSNGFLVAAITGMEAPVPTYGSYGHIDDVVDVHLKALFPASEEVAQTTSFGIGLPVDYDETFPIVEKNFPEAVANGTFSKGTWLTIPMIIDTTEMERVLGIKFKSFEQCVLDTARQYLELVEKEKA